ncbi:hypothetical protein HDU93_001579 [Gonapodya sp. JEL0774]|nr:hypothetical protein HDU93_001579 [Gonapodya sp. JEL0774]
MSPSTLKGYPKTLYASWTPRQQLLGGVTMILMRNSDCPEASNDSSSDSTLEEEGEAPIKVVKLKLLLRQMTQFHSGAAADPRHNLKDGKAPKKIH